MKLSYTESLRRLCSNKINRFSSNVLFGLIVRQQSPNFFFFFFIVNVVWQALELYYVEIQRMTSMINTHIHLRSALFCSYEPMKNCILANAFICVSWQIHRHHARENLLSQLCCSGSIPRDEQEQMEKNSFAKRQHGSQNHTSTLLELPCGCISHWKVQKLFDRRRKRTKKLERTHFDWQTEEKLL